MASDNQRLKEYLAIRVLNFLFSAKSWSADELQLESHFP